MKREREKHITRLHIILFFLFIFICLFIYVGINISKRKSVTKYKEFENELVNASELYYQITNIDLEDGYEKKINIKRLNKQGLLQNDLVNKCKGYVIISSEKDIYSEDFEVIHRAYIKCSNKYTTTNYSEY